MEAFRMKFNVDKVAIYWLICEGCSGKGDSSLPCDINGRAYKMEKCVICNGKGKILVEDTIAIVKLQVCSL